MKIKKAILPIAGDSTRFLPFSKAAGKHFLPLGEKPILQILIEECVAAGVDEIILIKNPADEITEKYFSRDESLEKILKSKNKLEILREVSKLENLAKIHFVEQNSPRGDGDAILRAEKFFSKSENFLTLFCDEVFFGENEKSATRQLLENFENEILIALCEVSKSEIENFGVAKIDENSGAILNLVEKPRARNAPSNLAIVGKYILNFEIFAALKNGENSADGELRIIDGLRFLLQKGEKIFGKILRGARFDTGSKLGFFKANFATAIDDEKIRDEFLKFVRKFKI